MENFKVIVKACLEKGRSGVFILRNGGKVNSSELELKDDKFFLGGLEYNQNGKIWTRQSSPFDIVEFIFDDNQHKGEFKIDNPFQVKRATIQALAAVEQMEYRLKDIKTELNRILYLVEPKKQ